MLSKKLTAVALVFLVMAFLFAAEAVSAGKVNINLATAEELSQLKGIGPAVAQRIIEYRQAHGSFKKIDELIGVKGIGPKTFEAIRDQLAVE